MMPLDLMYGEGAQVRLEQAFDSIGLRMTAWYFSSQQSVRLRAYKGDNVILHADCMKEHVKALYLESVCGSDREENNITLQSILDAAGPVLESFGVKKIMSYPRDDGAARSLQNNGWTKVRTSDREHSWFLDDA